MVICSSHESKNGKGGKDHSDLQGSAEPVEYLWLRIKG